MSWNLGTGRLGFVGGWVSSGTSRAGVVFFGGKARLVFASVSQRWRSGGLMAAAEVDLCFHGRLQEGRWACLTDQLSGVEIWFTIILWVMVCPLTLP